MEKWIVNKLANSPELAMTIVFCMRLLVATLCGGIVGLERSKRFKDAGIRTHSVVACGAALLMLVSKFGFSDILPLSGVKEADSARIAAQIVSGIGFLGAAVVFKQFGSIHGLTTAAGIWTTAAIAMAIGSGMYIPGIFCMLLVLGVSYYLHRHSFGNDSFTLKVIRAVMKNDPVVRDAFMKELDDHGVTLLTTEVKYLDDNRLELTFSTRIRRDFSYDDVIRIMETYPDITQISV
ncbi:MAG: MgtC/SapB family protein [Clostridia bacterium]|nr:MgtC/SapB family protein [Clostridia bacterium]